MRLEFHDQDGRKLGEIRVDEPHGPLTFDDYSESMRSVQALDAKGSSIDATKAPENFLRAILRQPGMAGVSRRLIQYEPEPDDGRIATAKLRALGVRGILIKAAEQGIITQLACKMPECLCPEELGGPTYFEPIGSPRTDWIPTHEHSPRPKHKGGQRALDNSLLAHRLCNRVDYSKSIGRPYRKDLERARAASRGWSGKTG